MCGVVIVVRVVIYASIVSVCMSVMSIVNSIERKNKRKNDSEYTLIDTAGFFWHSFQDPGFRIQNLCPGFRLSIDSGKLVTLVFLELLNRQLHHKIPGALIELLPTSPIRPGYRCYIVFLRAWMYNVYVGNSKTWRN